MLAAYPQYWRFETTVYDAPFESDVQFSTVPGS